MPIVEMNWRPGDRQLRQFGLVALAALPLLGWLWGGSQTVIAVLALIGGGLAALGIVWPRGLAPVFIGLTLITLPIGMVIGELVLMLLYYVVFLPTGLIFKLIGRDALDRKLDRSATTYWTPKTQPAGPASYFHQY